jgi:hypothetical protein
MHGHMREAELKEEEEELNNEKLTRSGRKNWCYESKNWRSKKMSYVFSLHAVVDDLHCI